MLWNAAIFNFAPVFNNAKPFWQPKTYLWSRSPVIRFFPMFLLTPPPWKHEKSFGFLTSSNGSKGNIGKKCVKYTKVYLNTTNKPLLSVVFSFLKIYMHAKTQTYPLVSSRDIADNKKKVFKTTRLGLNRPNLSF